MALPLNVFKTVTNVVSTSNVGIYTAPVGYAGVVILAQCANVSSDTTHTVTFTHRRSGTDTEIVKDFPVPPRDTVSFLDGRLGLESGDILVISGGSATDLKFTGSILETLK